MGNLRVVLSLAFIVLFPLTGCGESKEKGAELKQWSEPPEISMDVNKTYTFTIETTHGTMSGVLFPGDAPTTVNNFVFLAREGYYDGVVIHRVLKGFVLQTGDPTGTGSGGPGYRFHDEPVTREYLKGTLAMANSGPNTNGSQFFVVLDDLRDRLPKNYTVFGQVDEGLSTIDAISLVDVEAPQPGAEKSRPVDEIIVKTITIQER